MMNRLKRYLRIIRVKWNRYWHWYGLQWIKIDEWSRTNGYW